MGLYERLTPVELLRYFGQLHGMEAPTLDRRVAERVDVFGITPFVSQRCGTLSTGQAQRVSVARALVHDPPALILDAPTASLDAATEQRIMRNIKAWAEHRTVFLISHRLSTARQADRIVFLKDGRVADLGSHSELMARPSEYRAFVDAELSATRAIGS